MKNLTQVIPQGLILLMLSLLASCRYDDFTVDHDYTLAEFPGNKEAAISYTFDDNCPSSFSVIAPLFKEYGYHATFFIISGHVKNDLVWQKWRGLNDSGFEIGNHTLNHPNLAEIPDSNRLTTEINKSYDLIREKIGVAPFSFAHPYNGTSAMAESIIFQRHFATRISPNEFCNYWGVVSETTSAMFDSNLKRILKEHQWLVIAGHGVNDGSKPITKEFLLHMLEETKSRNADLFIGTFGDMAKYKIERNNTHITLVKGEFDLTLKLESPLDTTVFNYPLTIVATNRLLNAEIEPLYGTKIRRLVRTEESVIIDLLPNSSIIFRNVRP